MNPHDYIQVEVGQVWLYPRGGDVFRVTNKYPSIGVDSLVEYTIVDLNTGLNCLLAQRDFGYYELKLLDEKDVPMALLGRD